MPKHEHASSRALMWDFDGTLVDSVPLWRQALIDLVVTYGRTISEAGLASALDSSTPDLVRILRREIVASIDADDLVSDVRSRVSRALRASTPWMPGVLDILAEARATRLPCALVSNSPLAMLRSALEALPPDTFACVVAAEDVLNSKPSPEPYLEACHRMAVSPREATAIEDSYTGASSALAAGTWVVHVGTTTPLPVHARFTSLAGVSLSQLIARGEGSEPASI